jgi:hypothetical protein
VIAGTGTNCAAQGGAICPEETKLDDEPGNEPDDEYGKVGSPIYGNGQAGG